MREWFLRTFFPGVVIRRLELELAEQRIATLEKRISQLEARPYWNWSYPVVTNYPATTGGDGSHYTITCSTNNSGEPPAALSLVS